MQIWLPFPHLSLQGLSKSPFCTHGVQTCKSPLPSLPSTSSLPLTACFTLPMVSIGTRLGVWAARSVTDRQWDTSSTPVAAAAFSSTPSPCSWKRRTFDTRCEPGPPDDRGSHALHRRDWEGAGVRGRAGKRTRVSFRSLVAVPTWWCRRCRRDEVAVGVEARSGGKLGRRWSFGFWAWVVALGPNLWWMVALGLPMKTLDLGLSWRPSPVRVDERLYANPFTKSILSFDLIFFEYLLKSYFHNSNYYFPYLLFTQSPIYKRKSISHVFLILQILF